MKITAIEIFTSSACNLNCSYCYICKNKAFFEYDKIIQNALNENLYHKYLTEGIFKDDPDALSMMMFWGGEPLLGIRAFGNHLDSYLDSFKNLISFKTSSNLTTRIDDLIWFIEKLDSYSGDNRPFTFQLQVSVDGPKYVTDKNRKFVNNSNSVTDVLMKNLTHIIDHFNSHPLKRVKLIIGFKSTVAMDNIYNDLTSEENILQYFLFFEDLLFGLMNRNTSDNVEIAISGVPNMATSYEYTVDDGKAYAKFIERLYNVQMHATRNFKLILLDDIIYANKFLNMSSNIKNRQSLLQCGPFCSARRSCVCLTPYGELITCHRAMMEQIGSYLEDLSELKDRNVGSTDESRLNYARRMSVFNPNTKLSTAPHTDCNEFLFSSILGMISQLANSDQISSIFKYDESLRLEAAKFMLFSVCMHDNLLYTSNFLTSPDFMYKLHLNGAFEFLYNKRKEVSK